jgi:hypothetical protein
MKQRIADTGPLRVFSDPRGRRRIVVGWLAVGAGGIFSSFVAMAGIGLLGGPHVPLLPWPHAPGQQHADPHGPLGDRARHGRQVTAGGLPTPGAPGTRATSTPSPAPGRSATPSPHPSPTSTTVTNRTGRTPPGRNRTPSPSPRRTK